MEIRQTTLEDLETVMLLYSKARDFMRVHGNPAQWGNTYPERELIEKDIHEGKSYVCIAEGEIVATFYFAEEEDPTYKEIEEGHWLNDASYGVVHRIVGGGQKGAASFCLNWCFNQCENIRIDTHRDNKPMQNLLQKNGFKYCGIIHIADGSERLAYQKVHITEYI